MNETDEKKTPGISVDHLLDDATWASMAGQSAVICMADGGNRVVYVSEAFERHTGYPVAEALGRNLSFLQGPDTEPEAVREFRRLITGGLAGTVRITNYRKDGSRFVHECEFRPVRDADGRVTHFVAIQRPV